MPSYDPNNVFAKILRGEFPAGERISELSLVSRLGVSRTPIRTALQKLAHEGLLESSPSAGFLVRQFSDRYEEAYRQLGNWLRDRKIHYHETVIEGIENAPKAFIGMFEGHNIGKQLVKVS